MATTAHSRLLAILPLLVAACDDDTSGARDAAPPPVDAAVAADLATGDLAGADLAGAPPGADVTPPRFAGLTQASGASDRSVTLGWDAASDDVTAAAALVYDVYVATSAGGESFAQPSVTSAAGATTVTVGKLQPSTSYWFVVRARDAAGNRDANRVERSAATIADDVAPLFNGAATATALTPTSVQLDWAAGMDDVTDAAQLRYQIFVATTMMTEDYATPLATTAPGATRFVADGLAPGSTYYFVVRARDQAGNVDGNTVEVAASTSSDTSAPSWAGSGLTVSAVAAPVTSQISVAWINDASDDTTATANMRYVLTWTGGGSATTAAGASSFVISGLTSYTTYTVTVAAEDEAGNQSASFGGSATTPVSFAGDVSPVTFTGICAKCHTWTWGNTVNVDSSLCGGIRILPGDPDHSVLFGAISKPLPGCPPDRMPRGGPFLTATQLTMIRTWIVQGANDN